MLLSLDGSKSLLSGPEMDGGSGAVGDLENRFLKVEMVGSPFAV